MSENAKCPKCGAEMDSPLEKLKREVDGAVCNLCGYHFDVKPQKLEKIINVIKKKRKP